MGDPFMAALDVLRTHAAALLGSRQDPAPLRSIFSELSLPGWAPPAPSYFAARPLRITRETLFPVPETSQATYDLDLKRRFAEEYAALPQEGPEAVQQLFDLLHEYAWAVPSGADAVVSLFDHARTKAAIAAAMAVNQGSGVLILGGDISGVQSFLYTLSAAGATRGLRARSFYLQMLTDACAHYVLRAIGMPRLNLLYSGGGRFYLVLPDNAETEIERWRRELGQIMLHRHQGELYVALGGAHFDTPSLEGGERFGANWQALQEAINGDKRRRFAAFDAGTLARELFTPRGHGGGEAAACVVCHFQGEAGHELLPFNRDAAPEPGDEGRRICLLCKSFDTLAHDLHNADYLILTEQAPALPTERMRAPALDVLRELGLGVAVADTEAKLARILPVDNPTTRVLALHDLPSIEMRKRFRHVAWSLRPMANETPAYAADDDERFGAFFAKHPDEPRPTPGSIKTFGMLVFQSVGVKRLGVLRMDVDDLGDIFGSGLRNASLARVGALSAALSRFFEGWVGELCRQVNTEGSYGARVYTVYSGGDDLFIVGAWDALPELARRIREDLRAYTLNPAIRLSGGLSLHPAKFPLYQAAQAADSALEQAKDRQGKDAWGFLEQVVGWGAHADELFTLQSKLTGLVAPPKETATSGQQAGLSRATLQVLQAVYSQYLQGLKGGGRERRPETLFYGPWIWHAVYQLARSADAYGRNDQQMRVFIDTIRERLLEGADATPGTGVRFIERVGLAARWAQLSTRKEQG